MNIYKFTMGNGYRYSQGNTIEEAFESMGYEGIPHVTHETKYRKWITCGGVEYGFELIKVDSLTPREYIITNYDDIQQKYMHPILAMQYFLSLTLNTRNECDFFSRQWLTEKDSKEPIEVFWKDEKTNL